MVGALALLVCFAGAGGVGFILYFLYAPKLPTLGDLASPPRVPGHMVIEPMFSARRAPTPPRTRIARGTGAVIQAAMPRDERTDKVEALPLH